MYNAYATKGTQPKLTDPLEIQSLKEETAQYERDRGDLPDVDVSWFASFEDYQEWLAGGRQRFSCS